MMEKVSRLLLPSEDCPFCGHAADFAAFAENEHARALYNIAPLLPGHSLIVPKRHVMTLQELNRAELIALFEMARYAAHLVMRVYGCDGYDLSLQQGASAGQTVAHLHVHVIPRRPGDLSHEDWHAQLLDSTKRPRLAPEEMAKHVAMLRRMMA